MAKHATKMFEITGNTYNHRDAIKRAGGRWDADRKCWTLEIVVSGMQRNDRVLVDLRRTPGLVIEEAQS
jgi:hypothetical protein